MCLVCLLVGPAVDGPVALANTLAFLAFFQAVSYLLFPAVFCGRSFSRVLALFTDSDSRRVSAVEKWRSIDNCRYLFDC